MTKAQEIETMDKQTLGQELIEAMEEVVAYQNQSRRLEKRTVTVAPTNPKTKSPLPA